jgi:transcription-repair coupling factor (superfamily II helicase)
MATSTHITVGGAPEGLDARLIFQELDKSGCCVVHVARDDRRLAAMQAALRFFDPGVPVFTFRPGTCCPSIACPRTRRSRRSGWRRSRR